MTQTSEKFYGIPSATTRKGVVMLVGCSVIPPSAGAEHDLAQVFDQTSAVMAEPGLVP